MNKEHLIVSETPRPFWQILIAALCFTTVFGIIVSSFLYKFFDLNSFKSVGKMTEGIIYLLGIGIGFSRQKKVYVNLKESKFKSTIEVGPFKVGKWKTINNYEYVSIFFDPSKSESEIFEVNLWYDKNKHFELFAESNFEDAISVGFDVSEELNIDLLDATIANDYKWIDKEELKRNKTQ